MCPEIIWQKSNREKAGSYVLPFVEVQGGPMEQGRILMIEDDAAIREGVRVLLEGDGFRVDEAETGILGLEKLKDATDLVILDIMMPGMSGIQTCGEIRKKSKVPVLFLTAKGQEADKLLGFTVGGDDYLVKPFSYTELLARVRALLRRRNVYDKAVQEGAEHLPEWLERGQIRINTKYNQVFVREKETDLTEMEYGILLLLIQYPQKIFSVRNLYESVWGEPFMDTSGNTVMVHVRRLRKKIEKDPQVPKIIINIWGKGYRFGS